jgi:hypothetical protein
MINPQITKQSIQLIRIRPTENQSMTYLITQKQCGFPHRSIAVTPPPKTTIHLHIKSSLRVKHTKIKNM